MVNLLFILFFISSLAASASQYFEFGDIEKVKDSDSKEFKQTRAEFFGLKDSVNTELQKLDAVKLTKLKNFLDVFQQYRFYYLENTNGEEDERCEILDLVLSDYLKQRLISDFKEISDAKKFVKDLNSMFDLYLELLSKRPTCNYLSYNSFFSQIFKYSSLISYNEKEMLKLGGPTTFRELFLLSTLTYLRSLPPAEAFAKIFRNKIPSSINGASSLTTDIEDLPSMWNRIYNQILYLSKANLYYIYTRHVLNEEKVNKYPVSKNLDRILPILDNVILPEIEKRKWLSNSDSAVPFYSFDNLQVDDSDPENSNYKHELLKYAAKVNTELAKLPKADPRLANIGNAFNYLLDCFKSYTSSIIAKNKEEIERYEVALQILRGHMKRELKQFIDDFDTFSDDLGRMFMYLMLVTHPNCYPQIPPYRSIFDDLSKVPSKWNDAEIEFLDKWDTTLSYENFWYNIFIYTTLNHLSKLPKDTVFELIFKKDIPLSIDGTLLINCLAKDHSQVCDGALNDYLSEMKRKLFKAEHENTPSGDELNDDPSVKTFSDLLPRLVDFIHQEIPKRKWLSSSPKPPNFFEFPDVLEPKDPENKEAVTRWKKFIDLKTKVNDELRKLEPDVNKLKNFKNFLTLYQRYSTYDNCLVKDEDYGRFTVAKTVLDDYLREELTLNRFEISDPNSFCTSLRDMFDTYRQLLPKKVSIASDSNPYEDYFKALLEKPDYESLFSQEEQKIIFLNSQHLCEYLILEYLSKLPIREAFDLLFQNAIPLAIDGAQSLDLDIKDAPLMWKRILCSQIDCIKNSHLISTTGKYPSEDEVKNSPISKTIDSILSQIRKIALPDAPKWLSSSIKIEHSITKNAESVIPFFNFDNLKIDESNPEKISMKAKLLEYTKRVNSKLRQLPKYDLSLKNLEGICYLFSDCLSSLYYAITASITEEIERHDILLAILMGYLRQSLKAFPNFNSVAFVDDLKNMYSFLEFLRLGPKNRNSESYTSIFSEFSKLPNSLKDNEIKFLQELSGPFWYNIFLCSTLTHLSGLPQEQLFRLLYNNKVPLSLNGIDTLDDVFMDDYPLIWKNILERAFYTLKKSLFQSIHKKDPLDMNELDNDPSVKLIVGLYKELEKFVLQKEIPKRKWLSYTPPVPKPPKTNDTSKSDTSQQQPTQTSSLDLDSSKSQSEPPVDDKWRTIKIICLILVLLALIGGAVIIGAALFRRNRRV
jgi:hypothetical protein